MTRKCIPVTLFLKSLLLLSCFALLAGCGPMDATAMHAQSATTPASTVSWIISQSALASMQNAGQGWTQADNARFFDNSRTYVLGTMPAGWNSISTRSFTSYASLQTAFANGTIPSSVKAILYDIEDWKFTPTVEQQHFAAYTQKAANLVHSHHMLLISTPATDLVRTLDPGAKGNVYSLFLSLHIIQKVAQYADVVEIQAQGSEANTSAYTQFVKAAAAQAKTAKASVTVLAGLSTNPDGQKVNGQQIYAAFQATHNSISGYWLNIPGQSSYCPKCGKPQPQVAIAFLRLLS